VTKHLASDEIESALRESLGLRQEAHQSDQEGRLAMTTSSTAQAHRSGDEVTVLWCGERHRARIMKVKSDGTYRVNILTGTRGHRPIVPIEAWQIVNLPVSATRS
jgi:hypothetical protein